MFQYRFKLYSQSFHQIVSELYKKKSNCFKIVSLKILIVSNCIVDIKLTMKIV